MSLDRRIYLATALAAFIAGTAVVAATPTDPYTDAATVHTPEGVLSAPHFASVLHASEVEPASAEGMPARQGLVIVDGSEGGLGVRAPAAWPIDLRREMSPSQQVVGLLR